MKYGKVVYEHNVYLPFQMNLFFRDLGLVIMDEKACYKNLRCHHYVYHYHTQDKTNSFGN